MHYFLLIYFNNKPLQGLLLIIRRINCV